MFAVDIGFAATHAAVGSDVNQAKADSGPDQWRPPSEASWCRYAVDWVAVKNRWDLTFTNAEVTALEEMLSTCETTTGINALSAAVADVSPTTTSALETTSSTPTTTTTAPTTTASTTAPSTTAAPATTVAAVTTAAAVTTTAASAPNCHPNYKPCVPNVAGDLNCGDIGFQVEVMGADPYGLDGNDNDNLGCESFG